MRFLLQSIPQPSRMVIGLLVLAVAAGPGLADDSSPQVDAEDEPARPLRAFLERSIHEGIEFKGGFTAIAQTTSDHDVEGDLGASIDLVLRAPMGRGRWLLYIESSSAPGKRRVTSRIPEANADAGSALESDGDARVQISELRYRHPLAGGHVSAGLLDASAFLDTSRVANDETTQFLAGPLGNNPVVAFPGYTLGAAWQLAPTGAAPGVTLLVARSHGMGDDDPSYSSLFDDDVPDVDGDGRQDDKGWFAAAEGRWNLGEGETTAKLGVWTSTGDRVALGGGGTTDEARGVYGVLDGELGDSIHGDLTGTLWSVRAGWSDEDLSPGEAFLSGAIEIPLAPAPVGFGVAHTFASDELGSGRADTTVIETYARFTVANNVQVSPSLQFIRNSGLTDAAASRDDSIFVFGLRLEVGF